VTLLRKYEPATRATGGPAPGARALMAWYLGNFARQGGTNLGIYNNRTVRGGSTKSLHAEGRAVDFGVNPHGAEYGTLLAERLRLVSGELGIQCIIWNRRIWSSAYPDAGWRRYSGTNPHLDHLHVELTRSAASLLTPQRIQAVMAPRHPAGPAPVVQAKAPPLPVAKDNPLIIKSQPDKSKPEYVAALLTGFNFVGLGRTETPTDQQAKEMGLPVLWVEYGTYQEFDRRSHVMLGDGPPRVNKIDTPSPTPASSPNAP
jgi:hypothetical protein